MNSNGIPLLLAALILTLVLSACASLQPPVATPSVLALATAPPPTLTSTALPSITASPVSPTVTSTSRPSLTPRPSPTATPLPAVEPSSTAPPLTSTPQSTPTSVPATRTPLPATSVPPTSTPALAPSATAFATPVPAPPSPTAELPSPTPPPTATVAPPAGFFSLISRRLLHIDENGGCEGNHNAFVRVVDASGLPISGVQVYMRWDAGEDVLLTGYKPEFPGGAVFDMYGGYHVGVRADVGGAPASAPETFVTSREPTFPELILGGYCADLADCEYRASQDPPQFCQGHYSYEVTYQRGY